MVSLSDLSLSTFLFDSGNASFDAMAQGIDFAFLEESPVHLNFTVHSFDETQHKEMTLPRGQIRCVDIQNINSKLYFQCGEMTGYDQVASSLHRSLLALKHENIQVCVVRTSATLYGYVIVNTSTFNVFSTTSASQSSATKCSVMKKCAHFFHAHGSRNWDRQLRALQQIHRNKHIKPSTEQPSHQMVIYVNPKEGVPSLCEASTQCTTAEALHALFIELNSTLKRPTLTLLETVPVSVSS